MHRLVCVNLQVCITELTLMHQLHVRLVTTCALHVEYFHSILHLACSLASIYVYMDIICPVIVVS